MVRYRRCTLNVQTNRRERERERGRKEDEYLFSQDVATKRGQVGSASKGKDLEKPEGFISTETQPKAICCRAGKERDFNQDLQLSKRTL